MSDNIESLRDSVTADALSVRGRLLYNLQGAPVRCPACTSLFVVDSRGNCSACGSPAPIVIRAEAVATATATVTTAVKGVDISKWTTITNAVKAAEGCTFAIIRARDGIRDDSAWGANKTFAQTFKHWGAYAYFNPRFSTGEADGGAKQAGAFYEVARPAIEFNGLDIPLVIDCEPSPNFTMPPASRYLHELRYYVEALRGFTRRNPIIYSNLSFLNQYLEAHTDKPNSTFEAERNKQWLRDCPLWIAYPSTAPKLPTAWNRFAFWQYRLDVKDHPGLSVCDENYWSGTEAQLAAWCKSQDAPIPAWGEIITPPAPDPEPPTPPAGDTVTRAEFDVLVRRVAALEAAGVKDHRHVPGGVAMPPGAHLTSRVDA